ncbi:MAG: TetR/AcrR family transcriptional regulator [Cyclobacteriaceae bacterium]
MTDLKAEEKIKKAASEVFLLKGMDGARMQEIADRAGINKALLHYYYRSKEQLFQSVFEEKLLNFLPKIFQIFHGDQSIEEKVHVLADRYKDFLKLNPELPHFVLGELQRRPDRLFAKIDARLSMNLDVIGLQLKKEAQEGRIRLIDPKHFIANLISMIVFPFVASPLFIKVFNYDKEEYFDYLDQRKKEVPAFVMASLSV